MFLENIFPHKLPILFIAVKFEAQYNLHLHKCTFSKTLRFNAQRFSCSILIIFSKLVRYRIQCIYTIIPREFFILKSLVIIYEKRTRLRSMWFTVTHSMASPRYYLYWRLIRFHRWTRMTVCTVWEAVDLRCFRSVTTTNRSRRLGAASYQLLLSSDVY